MNTAYHVFPTLLASTVHDIKNSLGALMEHIHELAGKQPSEDIDRLEFEAHRINHSLMQLLVLYKIDSDKFGLSIDEYAAQDVIGDAVSQQRTAAVALQVDCSGDLLCYCDFQQIGNALGTILNNALRYCHKQILISAEQVDGFVKFCIEDDGAGYPQCLLDADLGDTRQTDWVQGNTGLGLYFVATLAGLHKNGDNTGWIAIDNQSRLGGARFSLYLP